METRKNYEIRDIRSKRELMRLFEEGNPGIFLFSERGMLLLNGFKSNAVIYGTNVSFLNECLHLSEPSENYNVYIVEQRYMERAMKVMLAFKFTFRYRLARQWISDGGIILDDEDDYENFLRRKNKRIDFNY